MSSCKNSKDGYIYISLHISLHRFYEIFLCVLSSYPYICYNNLISIMSFAKAYKGQIVILKIIPVVVTILIALINDGFL